MFIVTNIDLSIPSVVTLGAYVALLTISGGTQTSSGCSCRPLPRLLVGTVNAALVISARIPAIIATRAMGYVPATATLLGNRSIHGFAVSQALKILAARRLLGTLISSSALA